jgi:hypothetical protein
MPVFEVTCKLGKRLRLTEVQWAHAAARHPELQGQLPKLTATLEEPDFVLHSLEEDSHQYYRRFKETPVTEKYPLVVAKHGDGEGFVITAFFVAKVRWAGKELAYGQEVLH